MTNSGLKKRSASQVNKSSSNSLPQHPQNLRDYLPGGSIYRDMTNWDSRSVNPRGDMPVPQWLQEWEKKWEQLSREEDKDGQGKPKL